MAAPPGSSNEGSSNASAPSTGARFADMQLAIGTRLQLIGAPRGGAAPCFTMLIGYIRNEYLLLQLPRENGMSVNYKTGEELTVRVFSGTSVFTFPVRVERVLLAPLFQLYLSFPTTIESTALRAGVRIKVEIAASVTLTGQAAGEAPIATVITNLSRNGALIEADRSLGNPRDKLSVSFDFKHDIADELIQIKTEATIRSARERTAATPNTPARFEHGLQLALDASHQIMVQNYVYELLIADRQKVV